MGHLTEKMCDAASKEEEEEGRKEGQKRDDNEDVVVDDDEGESSINPRLRNEITAKIQGHFTAVRPSDLCRGGQTLIREESRL